MMTSLGLALALALFTDGDVRSGEELRLPTDLWTEPQLPAAGPGLEDPLPREIQGLPQDPWQGKPVDFIVIAGAHGRFNLPFGAANREVITYGGGIFIINEHVGWNDLFHPGWGFDLELDILPGDASGKGRMREKGFDYGFFVAILYDDFAGNSVSDGTGNFLRMDDLTTTSVLVGPKFLQHFQGGFFGDFRFGLGGVHYAAVEGTLGGPAVPDFRSEIFRDTWTFTMDLRMHGGVRLGPLGLTAGLGLRFQLPPSESAQIALDPRPVWIFDVDVGVELGF
jgi:hypothetical protein